MTPGVEARWDELGAGAPRLSLGSKTRSTLAREDVCVGAMGLGAMVGREDSN